MSDNYTIQVGSPSVVSVVPQAQQVVTVTTQAQQVLTALVNPSGFTINQVQVISQYLDIFNPSLGQVQFTLRHPPVRPTETLLFLNGQQQGFGAQYYIDGTQLIWTGAFDLEHTDSLSLYYS